MTDRNNPIILFDGVCNLCNGLVQFMLKHDKQSVFKFASLQSEVAAELLKNADVEEIPDSIIVIADGRVYYKSRAVLYICKRLGGVFNFIRIIRILPVFIRDKMYDVIAKKRYALFGKRDSCMLPSKKYNDRFIG
ncbi:thiol-disulfide oxidoreductase DCC family protein [Alkalihalobacillus sp. CinArs1]|uniref:thiol-disulfide oxidoreductase DCC family protein n=1 Tax=Alkalihalobacillus sp. CinArs1 TaxID=2995314 RepID=UPI0022DD0FB1|nr:thiol-disulfide oxidoreductase DCC family protein [Alkalihalobacillus sp. CinArs1]